MLKYAMLALILINGIIFAQNNLKAGTNIYARLVKGTSIGMVDNEFFPNEFLKMVDYQIAQNNSEGIWFRFIGHNADNIIVTYSYSEMLKFDSNWGSKSAGWSDTSVKLKNKSGDEIYFMIDKPNRRSDAEEKKVRQETCFVSLVYN